MVRVLSVLCALAVSVLACVGVVSGQTTTAAAMTAASLNDVTTLNYALTLENLESNFYQQGLAAFPNPAAFNNISAAVPSGAMIYNYLQMIATHEASHVQFLTTAINAAAGAGTAVPNCTYRFAAAGAFASPLAFLQTAAALENGGQQAYDGALNDITTAAYALVAAEIVTVEARHAAFLNLITGAVPFPQPFDNATLPAMIVQIISPFLVSCPYNVTLPVTRPTGVTLGATNTSLTATGSLNGAFGYSTAQKLNDIVALNYALTLENFEAAFYNYIMATFTQAQFTTAGFPSYYYQYLGLITSHENLHAATLNMVISSRGGTPVPLCTYNFASLTTPAAVLAVAEVLENTGVMAYDGAANAITDTVLQQVAATIATVEARHAAFLNLVNGVSPFPNVMDNGTSPAVIIAAVVATGFISCPYTPVGPVVISPFANPPVATVRGDPAFVGFQGQAFQVHGIPARHFALISTPALQLSATFTMIEEGESMSASQMKAARVMQQIKALKRTSASYSLPITTAQSHAGTFLGQVAFQCAGAKLLAKAGAYTEGMSTLTLNGKQMELSASAQKVAEGCYVTYSTPHSFQVDTDVVSFTLVNSDRFFNLEQATLNRAYTDDLQMEGLLGQTANPAWKVESNKAFREHMVLDYLIGSDDIFSNDFVSNLYQA